MKIYIGSDHAGYKYKEMLIGHLLEKGFEVEDVGANSEESVDYSDFGRTVGERVGVEPGNYGVLVCGTGIGIGMAAGKVDGVRAATVHDEFTAEMAKKHNNANVIAMGERIIDEEMAKKIVDAFFGSEFEGGRHARRVDKITAIENE
jgi:ribose 5-phosphate isomerase B